MATTVLLLAAVALVLAGLWTRYAKQIKCLAFLGAAASITVGVAVYLLVAVLGQVFSVAGLAWSCGLGPRVPYGEAVRVVTWLLVIEAAVIASMITDYLHAEHVSWRAAHWSLIRRLGRSAMWLVRRGLLARREVFEQKWT